MTKKLSEIIKQRLERVELVRQDYREIGDTLAELLGEATTPEKAREETTREIEEALMVASELTSAFFAVEQQANEARAIEAHKLPS